MGDNETGAVSSAELVQKAIAIAKELQRRAIELQTPHERRQQAELDRMLRNPTDKATLVQITDQAFRANSPRRSVDQFTHILDVQGVPRFFSPVERALLKGFQSFGSYLPGVAIPLVREQMQRETANVILPAETELLREHLAQRREQRLRMNVNFLGEAILSEAEARRRLEQYLEALQLPETEVFSIKISTLYSQISALAREDTIVTLCDRLEALYRNAAQTAFTRADGSVVPKFIYLDMEEYRDMQLTAAVFMRTLNRAGLEKVHAGIALQAYIPDSFTTLSEILEWARKRVALGGSAVTVRIVKGANMEMERVEASLKNWPQAPYKTKLETDANYKRMLHEALRLENENAVRIGVASHNLFEIGYAYALAESLNALHRVQFEMLEGMANAQRRAITERERDMLLYAPVARKQDFTHAIGYLIRRLDENTGPENFLRHAFKLTVDSDDWKQLETSFQKSVAILETVSSEPRRKQDRNAAPSVLPPLGGPAPEPAKAGTTYLEAFDNEPDTDWSLVQNSKWAERIVADWLPRCDSRAAEIPLVIDGQEIFREADRSCLDPSRPGIVVGRYRNATRPEIERAIESAAQDQDGWRSLTAQERRQVLRQAAQEIRKGRADLMGAAIANAGKTLAESDPEVSEAIDFCEFYSLCAEEFSSLKDLTARGKGVVAVIPPWNFPIAIPCGGVAAALAAGNTVILKPASPAVLVAYELCKCFWRAGISKRVLQFVPCAGNTGGKVLVNHPLVNSVILTGGTETALEMLRRKPDLHLCAETGGKNATIVTALADRDLAIKNVLHSAFSHAGQKCSATSLLLFEAEVYDDPEFKRALTEAAESIQVGSAWDLKTKMGPLIHPPANDLEKALKTLDQGESLALQSMRMGDSPNLWTPGIKYGVQPGSYSHRTEFFGPILSVMRFQKLGEAIEIVNQTGYGLTSGLESLDDREQAEWKSGIRAGNLYINRPTTGAIVLRQPFGGMGKSSFGSGLKAGGPNYVAQFMNFSETSNPALALPPPTILRTLYNTITSSYGVPPSGGSSHERARILQALASYENFYTTEFSREHDTFRLIGQDNIRRYLPIHFVRIRIDPSDSDFEIFARCAAARLAGSRQTVTYPTGYASPALTFLQKATDAWAGAIEFIEESDDELAAAISARQTDRVRYAKPGLAANSVRSAAHEANVSLIEFPVLAHGRVELLWYFHEQSISFDYHRYGNLGPRANEPRREPA
jgi:RHH-type proline utilization regulon transcriptional repressor/proline dehydrogenase/delta 1-pyrroline-5-carboxylate dehydrogenase